MKKIKFLSVIMCIPLLAFSLSSCSLKTEEKKNIAVIVKALDSDFWHSVKNGVDSAATEYNVSVTFEGPENEEDYINQNKLIEKAAENGADAIVLSAIDFDKNAEAVDKAADKGIKIITIDSNVNSGNVSMFIGTDNADAGRKAGRAVSAWASPENKINIGAINYYKSTDNGIQREEGFREYIESVDNADIVTADNVSSNTESVEAAAKALLEENPHINALVGFNEWMTLGIGNTVKKLGLSESVHTIGFDTNTSSVDMLETGEIDALIVQNPFAIGYLGVKNAAEILSGAKTEENEIYTDTVIVTKENLFDKDIQKLVFRFN